MAPPRPTQERTHSGEKRWLNQQEKVSGLAGMMIEAKRDRRLQERTLKFQTWPGNC